MSGARPPDGAAASLCWIVRFGDRELNFETKARAIAFLRRQTNDTRVALKVKRRGRGAYTYYGPGKDTNVVKADIDRVSFASLRKRAPKPLFAELRDIDV